MERCHRIFRRQDIHGYAFSPTNGAELGDYPSTLVTVNNDLIAPATLSFFQNSFSTSSWKLTYPSISMEGWRHEWYSSMLRHRVKASLLTAGFANPDFYADQQDM